MGEKMLTLNWKEVMKSLISKEMIDQIKRFKNVIVFGAGESGSWTVCLLRENGIFPVCYCDNYETKWGKSKDGIPIESFETAMEKFTDAAICIASMWSEDIVKQIAQYDENLIPRTWDLLTTMAWETQSRSFISYECAYIRENLLEFEGLYDVLADEASKRTLTGILNYRITRNKDYLKEIKTNEDIYLDRNIIPPIYLDEITQGSIIDGGAFDGDTVELFIEKLGKARQLDIHCYEAERENCQRMEERLCDWKTHKVSIYKRALWNSTGELLGFSGAGLSGRIIQKSEEEGVYSERIDDHGYDKVSMIKLDIEGAERYALEGAGNIIRRDFPVLAICAYHLQDDLVVLPKIIRRINYGYKLYLRHYMYSSGDTVLYAIPDWKSL